MPGHVDGQSRRGFGQLDIALSTKSDDQMLISLNFPGLLISSGKIQGQNVYMYKVTAITGYHGSQGSENHW